MRETSNSNAIDLVLAILQEQEVELGAIAGSKRQIHDIQVKLSNLVDSQGSEVERLSLLSIESFAHTNSGMEHLVQAIKYQQDPKSQAYSFMEALFIRRLVYPYQPKCAKQTYRLTHILNYIIFSSPELHHALRFIETSSIKPKDMILHSILKLDDSFLHTLPWNHCFLKTVRHARFLWLNFHHLLHSSFC
jgi:hypothetical protein